MMQDDRRIPITAKQPMVQPLAAKFTQLNAQNEVKGKRVQQVLLHPYSQHSKDLEVIILFDDQSWCTVHQARDYLEALLREELTELLNVDELLDASLKLLNDKHRARQQIRKRAEIDHLRDRLTDLELTGEAR